VTHEPAPNDTDLADRHTLSSSLLGFLAAGSIRAATT
jgi:hypothetical protein